MLDVRGVVELWLRREVRASRLRAFYGNFFRLVFACFLLRVLFLCGTLDIGN
jgi:hypothetical protein